MKLRKPCQHGMYDEHTVTSYVIQDMKVGEIRLAGSCPGGVFLPDDTLVIEKVDGEWPSWAMIAVRDAFKYDEAVAILDALSVRETE